MLQPLLCLACLGLMAAYLAAGGKDHRVAAAVLKGCASASFVLVGAIGACASATYASGVPAVSSAAAIRTHLVLAGLAAGAMADVVINLRRVFTSRKLQFFVAGAVAFLVGHVAYAASVWPCCEWPVVAVVLGVMVTVGLMAWVLRRVQVTAKLVAFGALYIGVVAVTCSLSAGACVTTGTPQDLAFAGGILLFLASDVVLVLNDFGEKPRETVHAFSLTMYYAGQLLIALSIGL